MAWPFLTDDERIAKATEHLSNRIRDLEEQLEIERSRVRVRDIEIEELAAVIARNLKRVQAETDLLQVKG